LTEKTLTEWIYKGSPIAVEDVPSDSIGFIYIITQKSTGKKYIGRKMTFRTVTRMIKGKKKKEKRVSDWPEYWSSSPDLIELIDRIGTADFTKEILVFCYSKSSLNYNEEMAQYILGVLEDDKWMNRNIRSKVMRSWVQNKPEIVELREILKSL
jgi:hypothetical protein